MEVLGGGAIRASDFTWAIVFSLFLSLIEIFLPTSSASVILTGSSLSASSPNQTWSSPNTTFSLHFIPITTTAYSLAITYGRSIPIWVAGSGAAVDSAASFHFLPDGDLRLVNGSGTVIWRSNTSNRGVSSASLDDSGNFVLKKGEISVWTSYQHPTDTIVPSQNFTVDSVLTSGSYSFRLNKSGNLTLKWNNSIIYWTLGVNSSIDSNLSSPSLALQSIGILSLSDSMLASPANMAYSSDFGEGNNFRFLRLDSDGNLRIYSASQGSETATVRWTGVSDQCNVFGYCGNTGICSYNDTGPICSCPSENFEFIDPNDSRKGCKRKIEIEDCPGNATMLQINRARFLTYPPETSTDVVIEGISACKSNCLSGSSCVGSTILADVTGECYIKTSNFVSGYQSPAIPSTSFVKVCSPAEPNPPPPSMEAGRCTDWKLRAWVVVVFVILGLLLGLALFGAGLSLWFSRKNPRFGVVSAHYTLLEYASGAPVQFSYKELEKATKGFREKLGMGGFGAVYRGVLSNKMVAAVKQLEGIEQGEKQFRMEVATISSTHHLNLVRLIGFCAQGRHRLLVYEFMKNSSLDRFLFAGEEESGSFLNWDDRFKIALGTARGITYLHEECRDCIIHCDIKPENILLDENYNAKVSDFGLAKLINPREHRHRSLTTVRGTRGYLAPEWLANLPITSKSDVYSYGMVLLEIVSGRRNFEVSGETNRKKFSMWAYDEFAKGNAMKIVDRRLADRFQMEQVTRAVQVSFWCILEQPLQRPTMGKVVQMLEGIVEIEKPPPPKIAAEDVVYGGGNLHIISSVSGPSTFGASGQDPSASPSHQKSLVSGSNMEGPASTLLHQSE